MAYKVNGIVRLDNSGNANLGIVTATQLVGTVSSEAITGQTAGDEANVTGADELLLYDQQTGGLLRVTVDEFIGGSGIGTIVTDFDNLNVTGITTVSTLTSGTFVSIGASLIPDTNITYDLGSDSNRFRDLYLEGNTIYLGDKTISSVDGKIAVDGQSVVAGAGMSVLSGIITSSDPIGILTYYGDGHNISGTGGGSILNSVWKWSSSTSTSSPGDGKAKLNNGTYASATEFRISKENEDGYDVGNAFGLVTTGARIYLQDRKSGDKYAVLDVIGAPTESTNHWTIPVLLDRMGSKLSDGKKVFVAIEVVPKKSEGLTGTPAINVSSVEIGSSGPTWTSGTGTPEGVVTAPVGSLYSRTDGGTGTSLYVKESGTGNTGWAAK